MSKRGHVRVQEQNAHAGSLQSGDLLWSVCRRPRRNCPCKLQMDSKARCLLNGTQCKRLASGQLSSILFYQVAFSGCPPGARCQVPGPQMKMKHSLRGAQCLVMAAATNRGVRTAAKRHWTLTAWLSLCRGFCMYYFT